MNAYNLGEPLRIGDDTQLLIDDTIVEDRWGLTRVLQHPEKYPRNPVLMADKPWEGDISFAPTVLWDEESGKYRMWYETFSLSTYYHGAGVQSCVCYAESDDGYRWEKPLFDHCPSGRYRQTNIVYMGTWDQGPWYGSDDPELKRRRIKVVDKSQLFRDAADPDPERRYKMITIEGRPMPQYNEVHCGVNMSCSPDGIHWHLDGDKAILDYCSDCLNHVVYNESEGLWMLYCRPTIYSSGRSSGDRHHRRRVALMTSPDFVHWSYPRVVCYPDESDTPDYDHNRVFRQGNVYLMLYGAMEGDTTGRWELRLASSSDGIHWERFHTREAFLGRGPEGAWDAGGILPHGVPVEQGEDVLLYYSGMNIGQEEQGAYRGGVGLALLKKDRYVEQRAYGRTGYLLTREFILEGNSLRVNAEHRKGPHLAPRLRVEIVRHPAIGQHWQFNEVYEGFGLDDCDPIAFDHTDAVVTWRGKRDLSALTGKPVYLRFELQDMGLYAFRIVRE